MEVSDYIHHYSSSIQPETPSLYEVFTYLLHGVESFLRS